MPVTARSLRSLALLAAATFACSLLAISGGEAQLPQRRPKTPAPVERPARVQANRPAPIAPPRQTTPAPPVALPAPVIPRNADGTVIVPVPTPWQRPEIEVARRIIAEVRAGTSTIPVPTPRAPLPPQRANAPVPNYVRDIAPIFQTRCISCHQAGGVGPFSIKSYEVIRGFGPMIQSLLTTTPVAPQLNSPGGEGVDAARHQAYAPVPPDQTAMIVRWFAANAPRGTGPEPLHEDASSVISKDRFAIEDLLRACAREANAYLDYVVSPATANRVRPDDALISLVGITRDFAQTNLDDLQPRFAAVERAATAEMARTGGANKQVLYEACLAKQYNEQWYRVPNFRPLVP